MSTIITRAQWGARHPNGFRSAPLPAREVWLHHSVTASPEPMASLAQDSASVRQLEDIGQSRFGGGISYTFVVARSGRVFQGHGVDRQGAHTGGRNDISRAICLIGNYENLQPTQIQLDAVAWLLRHGHRKGWWTQARLTGGHRDVSATACPGRNAYSQIAEINRRAVRTPEPPERTWFDMASEEDLRKIVREELRDNQAFRGRGLDYVNDNPTTKDHQLARVHQYTYERDRPWKARMENPVNGSSWYMQTFLRNAYAHALAARDEARAVKAAVAANGAALEAIAKALAEHDGNADPETFAAAVREAAEAGAKAALESMPLAAVLVREDGPDPDESTPDEEQS